MLYASIALAATPLLIAIHVPANGAEICGPCPADWNSSGTVNSQDFFDFLTGFFNGDADFNSDGAANSQDSFGFLNASEHDIGPPRPRNNILRIEEAPPPNVLIVPGAISQTPTELQEIWNRVLQGRCNLP
jgi:hypothetical protein